MTSRTDIHSAIDRALTKRGYDALTPVQESMLAPELRDADLLVSAQTGSGKTVAFGISLAPTLMGEEDRLPRAETPLAIVIAPTRELALQVERELSWLYDEAGAQIATCVGGMNMMTERRTLQRGAHIVVGTPGRLRDHIERGSLNPHLDPRRCSRRSRRDAGSGLSAMISSSSSMQHQTSAGR
jgi:ATP-dependent RNA helicase DeaD